MRVVIFIIILYTFSFGEVYIEAIKWNNFTKKEIKKLNDIILNKPPSKIQKILRKYPQFYKQFYEIDKGNILKFFINAGYKDVILKDSVIKKGNKLIIIYSVDRGNKYIINRVVLKNRVFFSNWGINKHLYSRKNRLFSMIKLQSDSAMIRQLYQNKGFFDVKVKYSFKVVENNFVDIEFSIQAGNRYKINDIKIDGLKDIKKWLVRRELTFHRGDFFDFKEIERSRGYLFESGLFSYVKIIPIKIKDEYKVDISIDVEENKTHTLEFSVNYEQFEQQTSNINLTSEFTARNLFSNGWLLKLHPSYDFNLRNPDLYQKFSFELIFLERWFLAYRLPFTFYPEYNILKTNLYKYNERKIVFKFRNNLTEHGHLVNKFTFSDKIFEGVKDSVIDNLVGRGIHSGIETIFEKDTRDNIFSPSKGSYFSIHQYIIAKIFGSDNDYYKIIMTWCRYKKNISARLKLGYGASLEKGENFPIEERFFGGGANSWRGYKDRSIGFFDKTLGENLGGNIIILGNVNYNLWTVKFLRQILFFDIGNIYLNYKNITFKDIKFSMGTGLHILTPVGALRFEFGFPGDNGFSLKKYMFHFAFMPMF